MRAKPRAIDDQRTDSTRDGVSTTFKAVALSWLCACQAVDERPRPQWSSPEMRDGPSRAHVVYDRCSAGECTRVCEVGHACRFTCSGGECDDRCEAGSVCTLSCSGGTCRQRCEGGANCDATCSGGDCRQSCDAAARCETTCTGGGCQP